MLYYLVLLSTSGWNRKDDLPVAFRVEVCLVQTDQSLTSGVAPKCRTVQQIVQPDWIVFRANAETHQIGREGNFVVGVACEEPNFANQLRTVRPIEKQVILLQQEPRRHSAETSLCGKNYRAIAN